MSETRSLGNCPPNPLDKPGYHLDFHAKFDQPNLDQQKWLPFYLPQWSSRARSAPNYALHKHALMLQISTDQQTWRPEFDGQNPCSSLQTGGFAGPVGRALGQPRFSSACVVREQQAPIRTYTPQHGYFELRATGVDTPANPLTFWMIGYENAPEKISRNRRHEDYGQDRYATDSTH